MKTTCLPVCLPYFAYSNSSLGNALIRIVVTRTRYISVRVSLFRGVVKCQKGNHAFEVFLLSNFSNVSKKLGAAIRDSPSL